MSEMKIINYQEKYHDNLKRLSYEWLEKYKLLEPEDEKMLNNPKEIILDKGGFIFLAQYGEEIVGTVSLMKINDDTFEIVKLSVTKKYQGLNIGEILIRKCLYISKQNKAIKVILFSNHILKYAIDLYKRIGFKEVAFENNKYIESDLKMELIF
ncbi:GNAT family N-acetyltransferase [Senegalia massiliensis]|uniref:GNAT family N-acetyltransferase n=1 Tax=Senegalia massiliensis TaxID=1720316 RepID=A0A845R448_9CLOT|nr:GNAT family N-acetyltransferase [Senegalia massiliensis]NBI07273.1 GNAT family N-acetyltransferase [Senegalia massiliensis]